MPVFPIHKSTGQQYFYGNPNVTITSIAGSIVLSRTSGNTPAFVHASASGITATGTDYPFRDLEFKWDFGDSASTEFVYNPAQGRYENSNRQKGPEAIHVYRSATGSPFTITLTVRGKNGSGYTTATFTTTFTVSTYSPASGPWYFDSAYAGENGTSDGTITKPFSDYATLKTKSNNGGCQIFIKYGSVFRSTGINSNHLVG